MKVGCEIVIDAPPQEVYATCMDPRRLDEWVTIHAGLKDAPEGELAKGDRLTQCMKIAGTKFNVTWTVVEDDCPRRVVWEGRGPMRSKAKVVYEFEADGNGGTKFRYENEYSLPGGPLGRMGGAAVAPASRAESRKSLEKLKKLLEG